MPRFMKFEENEDGTMTITTNIWGEETTAVMEQSFTSILMMMTTPDLSVEELIEDVSDTAIFIPNHLE